MANENKQINSVTVRAPVNIAVIKYWGKKDEVQILALNDSISGTLSTDHLCAKTSVATAPHFTEDIFWLNGEPQPIISNKRMTKCIEQIRKLSPAEFRNQKLHICSENNFPTAAGLASSAAGYACLVYALGKILQVTDEKQLSILARQGSGSACRSIYGGFVQWVSGPTSELSFAQQICNELHWPEMRVVILVVNDRKKDTSSTTGMQLTVTTCPLMQHRVQHVLPQRVAAMKEAINTKNFENFAKLTMQDSNQFHAVCLDTYPPIRYMNDISSSIVRVVHKFNDFYGKNRLAYTFDAGPNACIYLLEDTVDEFLSLVHSLFPAPKNSYTGMRPQTSLKTTTTTRPDGTLVISETREEVFENFLSNQYVNNGYYRGLPHRQIRPSPKLWDILANEQMPLDSLKGIISTKIGGGPSKVDEKESLLNENGWPKVSN